MIRSHRYRPFCATVLAAGAIGLGQLVPAWWLATPAPRAVIPFGAGPGLWFTPAQAVFAPCGSSIATVRCERPPAIGGNPLNPGKGGPPVIQLWDSQTGKLRAELCKLNNGQIGFVEFSADGKRVRVDVADVSGLLPRGEPRPDKLKDYHRCWDLATLTECDAEEPFEPFEPFSLDYVGRFEVGEGEMEGVQFGCTLMDCAPGADAVAFVPRDGGEIRLGDTRDHTSRKIADLPRGRDPAFAISPDAGQLVMNGPPHTSTGVPLLDRVWHWLDPELDNSDPDAEEDQTRETVSYAADVASGRVLARWKTPHVDGYRISPDGRTLAVISEGQIAFYDAPFREPWLRRLALGLAAGAVTFGLAQVVLGTGTLSARLRAVVPFSRASRKTPA